MSQAPNPAAVQCQLTTTGRTSGQPHTVSVWFAGPVDDVVYLLARSPTTDWVRNLRTEAAVTITVRRRAVPGAARVVTAQDESRRAQATWYEKYSTRIPGLLEWNPEATVVAVDLTMGG